MSDLLLALANAKPANAVPVADDTYEVVVVSAQIKAGNTVPLLLRLDLETRQGRATGGKFTGRRQVKNQSISVKAADFVAGLMKACEMSDVLADETLRKAFLAGEEVVMRRFVGKRLTVVRAKSKDSDEVRLDIVLPDELGE
jgi:hypothetical protein